ncbi:MAG: TrkH family potassium uptake protein [Spirochaetes bacterium]|nr:TrkH family potassium uptake protein [Spirochaetota bacterium]MBU1079752.1 TrkH family potassium uptake protein [Spirochaetota bacterium]
MIRRDRLIFVTFGLSVVTLFIERMDAGAAVGLVLHVFDTAILALILFETALAVRDSSYRWNYVRTHLPNLMFVAGFTGLFFYSKYMAFFGSGEGSLGPLSSMLRNGFLVVKVLGRMKRLYELAERLARHPAQTVIASFILVILAGAFVLMLPLSTTDGKGLPFLDAAFTATSAVCVTGLVVVDTATVLTRTGQAAVLVLIQIGGLGIMAFSFFAMFSFRRKLSVQDKLTVSFMLGEDDMSNLSRGLRVIVLTTLGIEAAGAALLFARLSFLEGPGLDTAFRAIFHSVSAFCNAGFALYSDSLESFRGDAVVMAGVAALIVLGGISFGVMNDSKAWISAAFRRIARKGAAPRPIASVNSKAVLTITAVLLAAGFCGFYLLEHEGVMAGYRLGEQYLAAAFQSVTLRTAGFNSVPFGALRDPTLLFMIVFMFIGGASGSTAGGVKVNSLAAIGAYFNAFLRQERTPRIGASAIAPEKVGKAFLILLFGLGAVLAGAFSLSLTEDAPFLSLLFEAVSAFGTVGLSTGVTAGLTGSGKVTIIVLMFLGRLGPLTILSAASRESDKGRADYPLGDLAIG